MAVDDSSIKIEKPPILLGTWGFDHASWSPAFYPEELPEDWRFPYYSNWFRALLLPAETVLRLGRAVLATWPQDIDDEFRFIVELPEAPIEAALRGEFAPLDDFIGLTEPLAGHTAGYVVPSMKICEVSDDAMQRLFASFRGRPVCMEMSSMSAECARRLTARGAGVLWRPAAQPAPVAGGALLVVRTTLDTPAAQRQLLEVVNAWQGGGGQAAIFFESPATARQARLLAELMDI